MRDKHIRRRGMSRLPALLLPAAGLISLIWFLTRVIPKPSRAAYPCQRVAAPLAGGFVLWITGVVGSVLVYPRGRMLLRESRLWKAVLILAGAAVCLALVTMVPYRVRPAAPHGPIGVAKGIHPGRVVWVYNPGVSDWEGYSSSEHWYDSAHTNQAIADRMMSQAIRGVAGARPTTNTRTR